MDARSAKKRKSGIRRVGEGVLPAAGGPKAARGAGFALPLVALIAGGVGAGAGAGAAGDDDVFAPLFFPAMACERCRAGSGNFCAISTEG